MRLNLRSLSQPLLLAGVSAAMVLAATSSQAQGDPPPGAARFAHLEGNVSVQLYGDDNWGQAGPNQPAGPGDRVYTDQQSRGELQAGPVRAYFSPNIDLTLVGNDNRGVEYGQANGSTAYFSDGFPPGNGLAVSTPNGAISASTRVSFRVDVYADQQTTIVTNYDRNSSQLTLSGGGDFYMTLDPGQSVQLSGTNPVYAQPLQPAQDDDFGHWSLVLDTHRYSSISARYVSPEMAGYDELDNAGDWQPDSDYGPIWFPRVEPGWAPYRNGHWVNQPPYGWTWVAEEPWGAAPFHYGRWVAINGRWAWIPGPREAHPVWSPAQVVFAGGVQVGGVGVSVWFPLGPGEAYKPWYPCSPQYIDRINISNIRPSRVVHVQNTYVNVVNVTNVTYINRTYVTAVRQDDFAAGRSTRTVAVKVDPREVERIQPSRPEARPPAQPVILRPVARPVAVPVARPVLINTKGLAVAAAPNAKPVPIAVHAAPPPPPPIAGRAPIGNPTIGNKPVAAPMRPVAQPAQPIQAGRPTPVPVPAHPTEPAPVPARPAVEPVRPVSPAPATPVARPVPAAPVPPTPAPRPAPPVPSRPEPARPEPATPIRPVPAQPVPPQPARPAVEPVRPVPQPPPQPAVRPVPGAPEARPGHPDPKDNKKPQDKKEDRKQEEKKPE
jgi:hypothetical protein